MMASYDPIIIATHADRLYRQAAVITIYYAIVGAFMLPTCVGLFASLVLAASELKVLVFLCMLVGGVAGYVIGMYKSFELRLRAQLALCQLQTEINTRGHAHQQQVQPPHGQHRAGPDQWHR